MSDFLFSARPLPPGQLAAALASHPGLAAASLREVHGAWGSLAVTVPAFEAHAVCEGPDHLTVVVGGPVVRLPGTPPGRVELGERRRLLHERLAEPHAAMGEWLDGQFAVLVLRGRSAAVFTDRFGHVPVFHAADAELVGTHVDAVARAAGGARRLDLVSAADLVANLTCTFPFTLYEGVRQLRPGALHRFGERPELTTYWSPEERAAQRTVSEAAAALREGFLEGVASACAGAAQAGVLLSGGEDSRAVLAAIPPAAAPQAFIYAEWDSREVRIARRAAAAHGAPLHVGLRAPDHYEAGFERTVPIVGSHHHFIDLHGWGLHEALGLPALPVVLGGYSADSILKDRYWKARGPVPFRSPRLAHLRAELLGEVDARRGAWFAEMRRMRPESAEEWQHVWPLSVRRHGGNIDGNRRLFRSWEAFHATAVLDVAATAPLAWRRHRKLYHEAFQPLFAKTRLLPHAEYRFPYYGRLGNALLLPPLALARGAAALLRGEARARHRPWPKWGRVADSALMRGREDTLLDGDSPLAALFDTAPERALPAIRAWYSLRRLMLVQLAHLVRT